MAREIIIAALQEIACQYGYSIYNRLAGQSAAEIKTMPAIWITRLELLEIAGRQKTESTYLLEMAILARDSHKNCDEESVISLLENDSKKIYRLLSEHQQIRVVEKIKMSPKAGSYTQIGETALDISLRVKIGECTKSQTT